MKDLTAYAQDVSNAANLVDARAKLDLLIDQFQHTAKCAEFKRKASTLRDLKSIHKWAWDLVLVGHGLKVIH